tara:strand:+ start:658 stop:1830 length:1173 start_codon:yes stop_codon:yes gene_type:complete
MSDKAIETLREYKRQSGNTPLGKIPAVNRKFQLNELIGPVIRWGRDLSDAKLWPEGKSLEGFLNWMKDSFKQAQTAAAQKSSETGIPYAAGHGRGAQADASNVPSNLAPQPAPRRNIDNPLSSTGYKIHTNEAQFFGRQDVDHDMYDNPRNQLAAFREYLTEDGQWRKMTPDQQERFLFTDERADVYMQEFEAKAQAEGIKQRYDDETARGQAELDREQALDPRTGLMPRRGGLINNIIGLIPPAAAARDLMIFGQDVNEARQNANALSTFNAVMSGLQSAASIAELVPHPQIKAGGKLLGWPLDFVQQAVNDNYNYQQLTAQPAELPEPTITQNTDRGFGYIGDQLQQAYENLIYGDKDTSAYDRLLDEQHRSAQQEAQLLKQGYNAEE